MGLKLPIGLQLYSVRQLLAKDFDGTLRKIKAAGYTEVEAAGYYDRTAPEFRQAMDKAGLRCTSTHHPLDVLRAQLDELIEYGHKLGLDYIVSPSASHRDPAAKGPMTMDDWRFTRGRAEPRRRKSEGRRNDLRLPQSRRGVWLRGRRGFL